MVADSAKGHPKDEMVRTFRLRKFELQLSRALPRKIGPSRTIEGTGRVGKKKLSWDPSSDSSTEGYRVYWEVGEGVGYHSLYAEVGKKTAILLPDEIPAFPLVTGRLEIGITSVSRSGNESDMLVLSSYFDFSRPGAPVNVALEEI